MIIMIFNGLRSTMIRQKARGNASATFWIRREKMVKTDLLRSISLARNFSLDSQLSKSATNPLAQPTLN
jgi:hypothetical protein